MRAYEFLCEVKRVPPVSLRHVNKTKKDEAARQASFKRRSDLVRLMYPKPGWELQRIELEKARIELEQQKTVLAQQQAELANTRSEVGLESKKAIKKMAAASIKTRKDRRTEH